MKVLSRLGKSKVQATYDFKTSIPKLQKLLKDALKIENALNTNYLELDRLEIELSTLQEKARKEGLSESDIEDFSHKIYIELKSLSEFDQFFESLTVWCKDVSERADMLRDEIKEQTKTSKTLDHVLTMLSKYPK